jgi:hypothetical protein
VWYEVVRGRMAKSLNPPGARGPSQARSSSASASPPPSPGTRAAFVAHLLADSVLASAIPRFEEAGVAVVLVKGIVTSKSLYADVSERPITDVDLRVRPRDLARVLAVGQDAGWDVLRHSLPYGNIVFRADGMLLDVEASIGPPGLCALAVDDLVARAVRARARAPVAYEYLAPELHDHVVVLCVNAFKDKLPRNAPWIVTDLERIVLQPGFDAGVLAERARASRSRTIVWMVADWMVSLSGHRVWAAVRDRIGPEAPRPAYARLFRALHRRHAERSLALRTLARVGSDAPWSGVRAILVAAAFEAEIRWKEPDTWR